MRYATLLLVLPVLLFSIGTNDLEIFSYPVLGKASLVLSFGDPTGIGFGVKDEGFEAGLSLSNHPFSYVLFKSSRKMVIVSSESYWFVSSGGFFGDFSYTSLSMTKTPILARFAARMALLPKCEKGDSECEKKRKQTSDILNTIFESAFLYRKISSRNFSSSVAMLKLPNTPAFGFANGEEGLLLGVGDTNGKSGWLLGGAWNGKFGVGAFLSEKIGIFQVDVDTFLDENGISGALDLQVNLRGGKLFVLLSKNGFEFFIF